MALQKSSQARGSGQPPLGILVDAVDGLADDSAGLAKDRPKP